MINFLKAHQLNNNAKIALYFHIPFCSSKCYYCDFYKEVNHSNLDKGIVVKQILQDAIEAISFLNLTSIDTLYIGGGTPSFAPLNDIIEIIKLGKSLQAKEITIEANPESLSQEFLEAVLKAGVTRISMGVQSFNQIELDSVGRKVDIKTIDNSLAMLQPYNNMINLDLIAGLPHQTADSLSYNIDRVLKFNPSHTSLYQLTIEEDTPFFNMTSLHKPSDEMSLMWITGKEQLNKAGFVDYEISNFAKDKSYSLHNLIYWQMDNFLGFGPSATSNIALQDGSALRIRGFEDSKLWQNNHNLYEQELISREDFIIEHFIMGLRTQQGINKKLFIDRFGEDKLNYYKQKIVSNNWVENEKNLSLNDQSRLFLNSILTDLIDFKA